MAVLCLSLLPSPFPAPWPSPRFWLSPCKHDDAHHCECYYAARKVVSATWNMPAGGFALCIYINCRVASQHSAAQFSVVMQAPTAAGKKVKRKGQSMRYATLKAVPEKPQGNMQLHEGTAAGSHAALPVNSHPSPSTYQVLTIYDQPDPSLPLPGGGRGVQHPALICQAYTDIM